MKKITLLTIALSAASLALAQTNAPRKADRTLQYTPDGRDFVCTNGNNQYTRAIYGNMTPYRLETSDRPVFSVYNNGLGGNISFSVIVNGHEIPLRATKMCEARYTPGRRTYLLSDNQWGKGTIKVSALVARNTNASLFKIESSNMPKGTRIISTFGGATRKRLSRNGDLGLCNPQSYELPANANDIVRDTTALTSTLYYGVWEKEGNGHTGKLERLSAKNGAKLFNEAETLRAAIANRIEFNTPDAYMNTLGGTILMAADGIWDGTSWLHGAVGWRVPLPGWRAAYCGDVLGWHDRARTHFTAYGNSMVTDIEPTQPQAVQDTAKNVARALEQWGTQMFSKGYICPLPNNTKKLSHYDMNLRYLDELLQHLDWTGDTAYAKTMWPKIKLSLEWQKRNFDPNNDGLYDAYANIWASDALYYNGGAVSYTSAFNYNANMKAARIARIIGEDATPFETEASRIKKAMNNTLWLGSKGVWAEYKDALGKKMTHESPALWTIYNTIDQNIGDQFANYQCTRWLDTAIPHIPLNSKGEHSNMATVSTSNWFPYNWSTNNVAFAEVMQTALSYWQAGRNDEAYKLMKSSVLDGMYLGACPGNIGQISHYDAARGEAYRDFGDPIGVASRAMIEGLYGIRPEALNGKINIVPGFPSEWNEASVKTPDIRYSYKRSEGKQTMHIENLLNKTLSLNIVLPINYDKVDSLASSVYGAEWKFTPNSIGTPRIEIVLPPTSTGVYDFTLYCGGKTIGQTGNSEINANIGDIVDIDFAGKLFDPQGIIATDSRTGKRYISASSGHHTLFVEHRQGDANWWEPVNFIVYGGKKELSGTELPKINNTAKFRGIDLTASFNSSVTDIFKNEYLTPFAPQTTLRLPKTGIGDWCSYNVKVNIDDSYLRTKSTNGKIVIKDIPFATPESGNNIVYTSQWDNYPTSFTTPLSGNAKGVYLLLAGSTNQMQSQIENGRITVEYADKSTEVLQLRNPDNWCPIEQDYYVDDHAFAIETKRPVRVALKSGIASNDLSSALGLTGINRTIDGGAATLLYLPLDAKKKLNSLTLSTTSNDVVIGLIAATLLQ
ncbi:MAG: DUF4450 domain-containing protein [Bacteroidaceae bacterium]|nr:DUF4450 domain-containing protein [Bacteroidaceae bacterium]